MISLPLFYTVIFLLHLSKYSRTSLIPKNSMPSLNRLYTTYYDDVTAKQVYTMVEDDDCILCSYYYKQALMARKLYAKKMLLLYSSKKAEPSNHINFRHASNYLSRGDAKNRQRQQMRREIRKNTIKLQQMQKLPLMHKCIFTLISLSWMIIWTLFVFAIYKSQNWYSKQEWSLYFMSIIRNFLFGE